MKPRAGANIILETGCRMEENKTESEIVICTQWNSEYLDSNEAWKMDRSFFRNSLDLSVFCPLVNTLCFQ